ncbi:MAG: hypothetical protein DHS20C17_28270 [Cyclobacteriaceae bacterium]|nr:MAG: hypothetical protein DHS20C17_28270 [Cyclobacteriaceae bacterium]
MRPKDNGNGDNGNGGQQQPATQPSEEPIRPIRPEDIPSEQNPDWERKGRDPDDEEYFKKG